MGGCVMVIFSHGTPSSMPLELKELSTVMRDDQGSLWITTFQYDFFFSSKSNTCWAKAKIINGSLPSTIKYQKFASKNLASSRL
jgi:hypothetical protein